MRSFFINRRYTAVTVDRVMHKAFSIDRTTALTPKTRAANDRILFTLNFYSVDTSVKSLVNSNFNSLEFRFLHFEYFQWTPIFSFKKYRNLLAFLV